MLSILFNRQEKEKEKTCKNKYNILFNGTTCYKISPEMKETIQLSTIRFINMKIREEELKKKNGAYMFNNFFSRQTK